jgi:hypothetical protein
MLVFLIAIDFLGNKIYCLISTLSLIFQVEIYWSLLLQHSISIIKALEMRHESSAVTDNENVSDVKWGHSQIMSIFFHEFSHKYSSQYMKSLSRDNVNFELCSANGGAWYFSQHFKKVFREFLRIF